MSLHRSNESISAIFTDAGFLECSSAQDVCSRLVASEAAACVCLCACVMPLVSAFFASSLLSSLWWKCDGILRLHPVAQLPAPLPTQQRLRLAHFRPLGLRHLLGFHQVKELPSSFSRFFQTNKKKRDQTKNVTVSLQDHLTICNANKYFPRNERAAFSDVMDTVLNKKTKQYKCLSATLLRQNSDL